MLKYDAKPNVISYLSAYHSIYIRALCVIAEFAAPIDHLLLLKDDYMEAAYEQLKELDPEERLFRHKLRPAWGIGLWVGEQKLRRRFVFQDGSQRAFRVGFYHLLEPVEPDAEDVEEVLDHLLADVDMHNMEEERDTQPPVMSFEDQVKVFRHRFPKGFKDKKYLNAYRRPQSGSARKAHIEPIMEQAQVHFAKERFERMIDAGKHRLLYEEMIDIMTATSLVRPKRIQPMEDVKVNKQIALVQALYKLLHDSETRYRERFKHWAMTLQKVNTSTNWPLATIVPALFEPQKHICIKRTVFDYQARSLPRCKPVRGKVKARRYRNGRSIARRTMEALESAGLEPVDMFDVRAFMWETLRPKGQKTLLQLMEAQ